MRYVYRGYIAILVRLPGVLITSPMAAREIRQYSRSIHVIKGPTR